MGEADKEGDVMARPYVWNFSAQFIISHLCSSQFQSFKWFDGLTMSGSIFNCFAEPVLSSAEGFKALRRFKVQEFKVNFHVSRILETWKFSQRAGASQGIEV